MIFSNNSSLQVPKEEDCTTVLLLVYTITRGQEFIAGSGSRMDDHQNINIEERWERETAFVETVASNESLVVVGVEEMELEILR